MPQTKQLGVQLQGDAGGMNSAVTSAAGKLGTLKTAALGVGVALGAAVAGGAAKAVTEAAAFESQMADIEKVTNPETARKMGVAIKDMASEMPVAHKQLSNIAEEAGRLGIKGVDNIREFTRVTAEMSVATDLMAKDAAKSFAKLTTLLDEPISNVRNMGAAINELSNNAAASASEIVDAMLRSAASLSSLGLSSEAIMALNTTVVEVSASAQRAGTRIRRLGTSLMNPKKIEEVASAYGMNADELARMRDEAPLKVIDKLVGSMRENGKVAEDLGMVFNEVSMKALRGLAANYDQFQKLLEQANVQMDKGGSLAEEYQAKLDTFNSQVDIFQNNVRNAWMALGDKLLPTMTKWVETGLTPAAKSVTELIKNMNTWSDVIEGLSNLSPQVSFVIDFIRADNWEERKEMIRTALEDTVSWWIDLKKGWGGTISSLQDQAEQRIDWFVDLVLGKNEAAKEAENRINWFVDLLKGSDAKPTQWAGHTIGWFVDLYQGTVTFSKETIKNAIEISGKIKKEVPFEAALDVSIDWGTGLKDAVTSSDPVKNLTKKGIESPVKMTITSIAGGAIAWKAATLIPAAVAAIPGGMVTVTGVAAALAINKIDPDFVTDVSDAVKSAKPIQNLVDTGIKSPISMTISSIVGGAVAWKAATALTAAAAGLPGGALAITGALAVITIGKILDVNFGFNQKEMEKKVQKNWEESDPTTTPLVTNTSLNVEPPEGETEVLNVDPTFQEKLNNLPINFVDDLKQANWGKLTSGIQKLWGGAMKQFSYSWPSIKLKDISGWAKKVGGKLKEVDWNKWTTFEGLVGALGSVKVGKKDVSGWVKSAGNAIEEVNWGDYTTFSGLTETIGNIEVGKKDLSGWASSIGKSIKNIEWGQYTTITGLADAIEKNMPNKIKKFTMDVTPKFIKKTIPGWIQTQATRITPDWIKDLPSWAQKVSPKAVAKWVDNLPEWTKVLDPTAWVEWKPQFPGFVDKGLSIIAKIDWKNLTPNIDWPSVPSKLADFFTWQSGTPWTGSGPRSEIAGFVHHQEAVLPTDVLKGGASAVLDFLGMNPDEDLASPSAAAAGGGGRTAQIGPITIYANSKEEGRSAARGLKEELESANF